MLTRQLSLASALLIMSIRMTQPAQLQILFTRSDTETQTLEFSAMLGVEQRLEEGGETQRTLADTAQSRYDEDELLKMKTHRGCRGKRGAISRQPSLLGVSSEAWGRKTMSLVD